MTIFEPKHVNKPLPCPHARSKHTNDKVWRKIGRVREEEGGREREREREKLNLKEFELFLLLLISLGVKQEDYHLNFDSI